jgi:putative ABC transport system permease protein
MNDLRFAFRMLAKDRRFAILAVTVLGLGMGVNNTQFILVNAICLRGLPIERVDRVVWFGARDTRDRDLGLSYREFDEAHSLSSVSGALEGIAAYASAPMVIGDEGRAPDRALGLYISANGFRLLREKASLGRDLEPGDDRAGAPAVVVLGGGLWKSRYGGDPSIVGRTIRIDGTPSTVVGVMRDDFRFPSNTELWRPLSLMPGLTTERRTARALSVFGRLADGVTLADVRGRLGTLTAKLSHDYSETNQGIRLTVVPINERFNGRITDQVWIIFVTVGFVVLLVACANVANLLLMRSVTRGHEMAIRASLGASRRQLVRQLLIESAALAACGGVLGLGLSLVGVRILSSAIPANTLAYWISFTMDARAFAVLAAVSLGTVFVFGLAPAIHVSKTDVNQVMKEGGRAGTHGLHARRWTTVFLTAEFALSLLLLTTLVMSVRMARSAERAELVFDPSNAITTSIALPPTRYRTPDQRIAFYRQLHDTLAAIPGITSAAVTTTLPLSGASTRLLAIDGRAPAAGEIAPTVWTVTIGPTYFAAIGLQMLRGRAFGETDGATGSEAAIVNQRFVQMFFPNQDAIGRHIRLTDTAAAASPAPWLTIVGVSPTVRQRSLPDPDPVVYVPLRAAPPAAASVIVRTAAQSAAMAPLLRNAVHAIDADLPLYRIMSMDQALRESQWNARVSNMIATSISLIAVLLAAVGLYAVTTHAVAQRAQEIGVRMALGAQPQHVVAIVGRRVMTQLAFGLAAGLACTFVWGRLFSEAGAGAAGLRMTDVVNLTASSMVLVLVSMIATIAPAWRAAHLDPVIALRYE